MDQLALGLEPWLLPIADALDAEDARRENLAIEKAQRKAEAKSGQHRN